MLYLGLAVGAMLGICISIILLVCVKEFAMQTKSDKKTSTVFLPEKRGLKPSLLASLPSRKKEKWLGDVSR